MPDHRRIQKSLNLLPFLGDRIRFCGYNDWRPQNKLCPPCSPRALEICGELQHSERGEKYIMTVAGVLKTNIARLPAQLSSRRRKIHLESPVCRIAASCPHLGRMDRSLAFPLCHVPSPCDSAGHLDLTLNPLSSCQTKQ